MGRRPVVTIKQGREKSLQRHHPWVFSGAIGKQDAHAPGDLVEFRDASGAFLARGYANSKSGITGRVLSFDESEEIDAAFWRRRIRAAMNARTALWPLRHEADNATRVVMAEADRLPGLIVDRYGDYLVVQALTAGMDQQLGAIVAALDAELKPAGIHERSDDAVRELEGLAMVNRGLSGRPAPDSGLVISENGIKFGVELNLGHKTGFYLDQRQNHALAQHLVRAMAASRPCRVLDVCSYSGGFSLNALGAGASAVTAVDSSAAAMQTLQANLALNGFAPAQVETRLGNAFEVLRDLRREEALYDLVVLDPPKLAAHASQVDKAARAYKDLNMLGLKLLAPGGFLLSFSCSGHISAELFQKIVFGASADAAVSAQIFGHLGQADDHPVLLSFPESFYLKGLAMRRA